MTFTREGPMVKATVQLRVIVMWGTPFCTHPSWCVWGCGVGGSCRCWTNSCDIRFILLSLSRLRVASSFLIWHLWVNRGTLWRPGSCRIIRMRAGSTSVVLVREMNSGFSGKSVGVASANNLWWGWLFLIARQSTWLWELVLWKLHQTTFLVAGGEEG